MPRKLGVTSTQRKMLLQNQASQLLWHGKIQTTIDRAKEVKAYAEKIITLAVNTYADTIESEAVVKDSKGKESKKILIKDGVKKLNARRKIMTLVNDLQEQKAFKESKPDFKARTKDINHPLIEKIFNEIAPKYANRKEEKGQGGGYARIYRLGQRKGDAAEVAVLELVD